MRNTVPSQIYPTYYGSDLVLHKRAPSVQICVRYEENMVTKRCLRHPSGCPADYTIYMMVTCQLINILSMSNTCPPNLTLNIQWTDYI